MACTVRGHRVTQWRAIFFCYIELVPVQRQILAVCTAAHIRCMLPSVVCTFGMPSLAYVLVFLSRTFSILGTVSIHSWVVVWFVRASVTPFCTLTDTAVCSDCQIQLHEAVALTLAVKVCS